MHACRQAKLLQLCLTLWRPHGQQPTRLLCPQDSLGKNTGVGCHFLLHPMYYIHVYIFFVLFSLAYLLKKLCIYFNWRIITLQYCDGFAIYQHGSAIGIHVSPSSWTPLLPLSSPHPSRLSQSTDFGYPASYIRLPLAIYFTYGNVYVFLFNTRSTWASIWVDIKWLMMDFVF